MSVHPSFREALRFWLKLGFISFGGPAGQIAIMHTELVDRKKWIDEPHFLHALNYCMLLPGPEATQLATYCGWLFHGMWGGIAAGVLFVLPGAILLWALSWIYAAHGNVPVVAAIFYGLKPAVTAIVAAAVIKIGQRALKTRWHWALAAIAFGAIFFLHVPFPIIVATAAVAGWLGTRISENGKQIDDSGRVPGFRYSVSGISWQRAARVLGVCLLLWWTPVFLASVVQGPHGVLAREGVFFSQAAMVTFGGAYAVLPYVGQEAVGTFGWLTGPQMLDGLGLAETTPGPLIMVVQFVGFLGGWHQHGTLAPLTMATLAAAITTWTTFVPCFLWIFLGAPYVERLRNVAALNGALGAVTAAVVGVVLNLAVWFALQVFFPRGLRAGSTDFFAVALCGVTFLAMQRFKIGVVPIVLASGLAGLAWRQFAG